MAKRYFVTGKKGKKFLGRNEEDDDNNDDDGPREKRGLLSEQVMSYYRQVSSTLETGFDDESPDVKDQFITNVFSVLKDECVSVSQNQTVSRILEVLFTQSSASHLRPVFCQFCKSLAIVVFDAFASHVFQALIQYLPLMIEQGKEKEEEDANENINRVKESVNSLCTFIESHLRDVMTHVYGSHILRSLLETLSGVSVKAEIIRSRVSRDQRFKDIGSGPALNSAASKNFSELHKEWFDTISQKIIRLCNYEDHLKDQHYCPVFQSVLLILHKTSPTQYEELATTILEKTCASSHNEDIATEDIMNKLPDIVQNDIGSYLVELLISLSSGPKFEELYHWLFKGKLLYFCVHPYANYVLQKLLSTITEEKLMQTVLDDISLYIEDILAVNHCGIVTKLAEACQRTRIGQDQFLKVLMSAFHCFEPESRQSKLVPLLASFQTYEVFFKADADSNEESKAILKSVIIHGSLILQQVMRFSKTQLVVASLLELSPAELLFLCSDKSGSHVVDAFFQSSTINDKHRGNFIKKLEGLYINMACNRVGSRCLENIWKTASIQKKELIAEDLCKNQERLESDSSGRFIYRNFALAKFLNRGKEWREIQGADIKKQQLLKGILEGKQARQKKKKDGKLTNHPLSECDKKSITENPKKVAEKKTGESLIKQQIPNKKKDKSAAILKHVTVVPQETKEKREPIIDSENGIMKKKRKSKKQRKREKAWALAHGEVPMSKNSATDSPSLKKTVDSVSDSSNDRKKTKEKKEVAQTSDDSYVENMSPKKRKLETSLIESGENIVDKKKAKKNVCSKAESELDNISHKVVLKKEQFQGPKMKRKKKAKLES